MRRRFASAPSLLAMAAMMIAVPDMARAQSFNASGTIVAGAGAILTDPGTTTIAADTPNLVINWSPNDTAIGGGPINFQTAGTSALFTNRDATTLTVLNRIIPTDVTRPIVFNGNVTSQLVNLFSGAISRGGTLFFYSPGGILVSSTGVFNVGNLALTASDLSFDAVTGSFGTGGQYNFLQANAGSRVEVQQGARITAGPFNSYVALIAPRVINSGTINVDGSAVIVAADASTITFRPDGLYDIQIDQGTSAAGEVVTNDGTITGPVAGANAVHRVYMVAVPKNDAITMAIKGGSALGFDVAGAANVDGNAVVLSAGYDVVNGVINSVRAKNSGNVPARLSIGAIDATSQVTGVATGEASLTLGAGETATFASNVALSGVSETATDDGAFISVGGIGSTLDVQGNLQITSLDGGQVTGGAFTDSGNASVTVDRGSLTVGGAMSISSTRAPTLALDAVAGSAMLTASNGAVVDVGTDLTIVANGAGKNFDDASSSGPNAGTGGIARISLESDSSIIIGRDLALNALGGGGSGLSDFTVGSDGTGGQALVEGQSGGGSLTVTGVTTLDARGFGGSGQNCVSCTVEGGIGTGGRAGISLGTGVTFAFGDAVTVNASGQGGAATTDSGKDGGAGLGGRAFVRTTGGAATFGQTLDVLALGQGGAGAFVNAALSGATGSGGTGGSGTGGEAFLAAGDTALLGGGGSLGMTGATLVSAAGLGGAGGTGGAGAGGTATLAARNGTANGSGLSVRAYGDGGAGSNGGNGGAGTGGNADVIAFSALEGDATVTFASTLVDARGRGGAGSAPGLFPDAGGAGGAGTGGQARAVAEAGNANLVLAGTSVTANGIGGVGGAGGSVVSGGTGGAGGAGGNGRGGSATIGVIAGPGAASPAGAADLGPAGVFANGVGGVGGTGGLGTTPGIDGNGGNGYGGSATIAAAGGTLSLGNITLAQAGATGGNSGSGLGGNAEVGGAGGPSDLRGVRFDVGTGQVNGQTITLTANAVGGLGATSGTATILGHPLTWLVGGGTINAGTLTFSAAGTVAGDAPASVIALAGGDTVLTGNLAFSTPGDLTATLDGANVSAVSAAISAGNWLPGAVPAGAAGTVFGSSSVSLTTSGDLFAHLSANSGSALTLSATGLVRLDNLSSAAGVVVTAGSTVTLGNVLAGADVSVSAPGNVAVGNVTATGGINLNSNAALTSGAATAGQTITLDGATSVTASGPIQAGDSVRLVSDGAIGAGAISAGLVSPSAVSGATYGITVIGLGGVTLGNLAAAHDIVLLSPVTITSGSLGAREVAVLAGGAQSVGGITATGRVLLADYSMAPIGGDPLGAYDMNALLSAVPVATAGGISVNGAVQAGALTVRAGGTLALQAITTSAAGTTGNIDLGADGGLGTGTIAAAGRFDAIGATSLTTGDVAAVSGIALGTTSGDLAAGTLSSSNGLIRVNAGGNLAVTGTITSALGNVGMTAGGTISTQAISAAGQIGLSAGGVITAGNLDAGGPVVVSSPADVTLGTVDAGGFVSVSSGAVLTAGAVTSRQSARLQGTSRVALNGNVVAGASVALSSGGLISAQNLSAGLVNPSAVSGARYDVTVLGLGGVAVGRVSAAQDIRLFSPQAVSAGALAGREVAVLSGGAQTLGGIAATGRVLLADYDLMAPIGGQPLGAYDMNALMTTLPPSATAGAITVAGPVTGTSFAAASRSTITVGDVTTVVAGGGDGRVSLQARGALTAGNIAAGGQILGTSSATINVGNVTAGGAATFTALGGGITAGAVQAQGNIGINAGGALTTGNVTSTSGEVGLQGGGNVVVGTVAAGTLANIASNTGDTTVGDVTAGTGDLTVTGAVVQAGNLTASGGDLVVVGGADVTTGALTGGTLAFVQGGGSVAIGDVRAANGRVLLTAGGALTAGNLSAEASVPGGVGLRASSGTTLDVGNATAAAGELRLTSGGAMAAGDVVATGGFITLTSGGAMQAGALNGQTGITLNTAGSAALSGAAQSAAGAISFTAAGDLSAGGITASDAVQVQSTGGGISAQGVTAGSSLTLSAANDLTTGTLVAGGDLVAGGRVVTLGNLIGAKVNFSGTGALTFGDVTATGNVSIGTGAGVTGGSITTTGARIALSNNGGAVRLGNLAAADTVQLFVQGDLTVGNVSGGAATVELRAVNGALTAGTITAGTDLALAAANDISVGNVSARDMLLLAGGNVRTGSLTSPDGRILVASNALVDDGGAIGEYNFDAVFAAPVQSSGGALTMTGPVSGGTFTAAVAGDAAVQGITASRSITVDAGGTARLGGVWRSPLITLTANDLDMPTGTGLNAGLTGTISLISRNTAGMRIGDGLDGSVVPTTGFSIDNAEWGRVNSGSLSVFGLDGAGAVDIVIGKLDVTGPDAGSTIDDPAGSVRFSTGASPSAVASGAIRVVGALRAVGMRSGNALVFRTGQFQLASDTGSIAMLGQGDALSGTLRIEARDIHVAAAPLLARLAADPFFAGVEPALDRESAGGNGPVLRAGGLDFTVGRSFYIQRSGNGVDPLGFEEPLDGFRVRPAGAAPIAVIINGTFRTATGVIGGVEAWRQFKASGVDLSGFTADSRLNGCLLTAATCGLTLIKGQPDPGIRTVIDGVDTPGLDDSPSDPEKREPQTGNAILPPPLLLPVQPDALPGQIDEPIAGSGNPALFGGTLSAGARP